MSWITIIILGIAVNLDNMCIGMSYGISGRRIRPHHNIVIALTTGLFALTACLTASLISGRHVRTAIAIGSVILMVLGIQTIISGLKKRKRPETREQEAMCIKGSKLREVFMLGVALALNCLPAAFGAGLSEVPPFWLGISMTAFSYIFVAAGNEMGIRVKLLLKSWKLDIVSGVALICIAIWELFI